MAGELTCPNCGTQNPAGRQFCVSCDQYLLEGQPPARSPAEVLRDRQRAAAHRTDDAGERPTEEVPALGEPARASGTSGRDDARGTSPPPIPLPADLRRCPTCGTANELTRTFCMRCGTRLAEGAVPPPVTPVAPAPPTTRSINATYVAVGAGLGIVLLVALAFIFWPRGPEVPNTDPTATPTLIAGETTPPAAPRTPDPQLTEPPTPPATPNPSPPVAGFSCEPQTLTAAEQGEWQILVSGAPMELRRQPDATRLTFTVLRGGGSQRTASAHAQLMPPGDASAQVDVAAPPDSDVALVLRFSEEVSKAPRSTPMLGAHLSVTGVRTSRPGDNVVVVVGISGRGCYSLSWDDAEEPVRLHIDIER